MKGENHAAAPLLRVVIAIVLVGGDFPQHVLDPLFVGAREIGSDHSVPALHRRRLNGGHEFAAPVMKRHFVQERKHPGLAPLVLLQPGHHIARDAVPEIEDVGEGIPFRIGVAKQAPEQIHLAAAKILRFGRHRTFFLVGRSGFGVHAIPTFGDVSSNL